MKTCPYSLSHIGGDCVYCERDALKAGLRKAIEGLEAVNSLVRRAQDVLSLYLQPARNPPRRPRCIGRGSEMKLCLDCQYSYTDWLMVRCNMQFDSPVTGKPTTTDCLTCRLHPTLCGVEARWYKEKEVALETDERASRPPEVKP